MGLLPCFISVRGQGGGRILKKLNRYNKLHFHKLGNTKGWLFVVCPQFWRGFVSIVTCWFRVAFRRWWWCFSDARITSPIVIRSEQLCLLGWAAWSISTWGQPVCEGGGQQSVMLKLWMILPPAEDTISGFTYHLTPLSTGCIFFYNQKCSIPQTKLPFCPITYLEVWNSWICICQSNYLRKLLLHYFVADNWWAIPTTTNYNSFRAALLPLDFKTHRREKGLKPVLLPLSDSLWKCLSHLY